jgi:hypothetical protein
VLKRLLALAEERLVSAVSEVIEDGFHLFTGIVRDLIDEVTKERMRQAEEDCLQQMIWKVTSEGQVETFNKRFMSYT